MWNSPPTHRVTRGAWAPTVLGVLAAIGLAVSLGGAREPLLAEVSRTNDSDHDGIPDGPELVLGTLPGNPDTAGDG